MSPNTTTRRMTHRVFEDVDVSTTFHLDSLTRQTMILIEFRYFHPFIMTTFLNQKKDKTTLLSQHMLRRSHRDTHHLTLPVPSTRRTLK